MILTDNQSPVRSEEYNHKPAIPQIPSLIALSAKIFDERICLKLSRCQYSISKKPTYTSVTMIDTSQETTEEDANHSNAENSQANYESSDQRENISDLYDSDAMTPRIPSPVFRVTSQNCSSGSEDCKLKEIYECDYCHRTYKKKKRLIRHRRKRHFQPDNYSCKHCSKVFSSRPAWSYHSMAVHQYENAKPFFCNYCDKRYVSQGHLNFHIRKKHQYYCYFCMTVFPDKQQLKKHKNVHRIYKCHFCNVKGFFRERRLQKHLEQEHSQTSKEEQPIDEDSSTPMEEESIHDDPPTPIEEESIHDDPPTPMEEESIHDDPPTPIEDESIHNDPATDETLTAEEEEEAKPEICKYCGKAFSSTADLHHHWKVTGENLFICGKCLHVSENALSFSHHLLKHSEKKIFICTVCFKTFITMDILEDHFTTHAELEF